MGVPVDALSPAEAAGVIEFGPRMRFHHPLMRSAAYRAADLTERRTIHRALADATDPQSDPDRRAWHAANAAAGPDDAVAAELETSAGRAKSRGGIAAAATFLERATALTSDPALRSARAVAAAQAKRDAAAPAAAYELLAIAELGQLSDLQKAQVARLCAQMEFARSRGGDTGAARLVEPAAQLLNAAKRLEPLDDGLAREAYLEALAAAMYAGRLGEPGALVRLAEAALAAVGRVPTPHRPIDLLLSGMANRIVGGMSAGCDPIRTALQLMCTQAQQADGQALRWMSLGLAIVQESATGELWDDAIYRQLATAAVRQRVLGLRGLLVAPVRTGGVLGGSLALRRGAVRRTRTHSRCQGHHHRLGGRRVAPDGGGVQRHQRIRLGVVGGGRPARGVVGDHAEPVHAADDLVLGPPGGDVDELPVLDARTRRCRRGAGRSPCGRPRCRGSGR